MDLKATWGNIIVAIDIYKKDKHRFSNGIEIQLERNWNNFNMIERNPIQGMVVDWYGDVPRETDKRIEIIFQHTVYHDSYRIFNSANASKEMDDIRYYSVPIDLCYFWRYEGEEWQPMPNCLITTRVWKPYKGFLIMPPTQIKERLYVLEGEFKGNIVVTSKNCDYEVIFQGDNGKQAYIISTRADRDEILAIDNGLTELYNNGDILIGRTADEAKQVEMTAFAD